MADSTPTPQENCARCAVPLVGPNVEPPYCGICQLLVGGPTTKYLIFVTRKQRDQARSAIRNAVLRGLVSKPDSCSRCGAVVPRPDIEAHHPDYLKALDVEWLCVPCHQAEHKRQVA